MDIDTMSFPSSVNETAALMFLQLYYRVVAYEPHKLYLLYKPDAELKHESITASGSQHIRTTAIFFPMAGHRVRILSFAVMRASLNRTLAVTSGLLPNGDLFSQTFMLEYVLNVSSYVTWCALDVFMIIPLRNGMSLSPIANTSSPNVNNENVSINVSSGSLQNPSATLPLPDPSPQSNVKTSTETGPRNDRETRISTRNMRGVAAVVKLSSFSSTWSKSYKQLKAALYDEFSSYGYPVKSISIKPKLDIVFVNYSSIEGVRNAVRAWADGPRTEGAFAGLRLLVTPKRNPG